MMDPSELGNFCPPIAEFSQKSQNVDFGVLCSDLKPVSVVEQLSDVSVSTRVQFGHSDSSNKDFFEGGLSKNTNLSNARFANSQSFKRMQARKYKRRKELTSIPIRMGDNAISKSSHDEVKQRPKLGTKKENSEPVQTGSDDVHFGDGSSHSTPPNTNSTHHSVIGTENDHLLVQSHNLMSNFAAVDERVNGPKQFIFNPARSEADQMLTFGKEADIHIMSHTKVGSGEGTMYAHQIKQAATEIPRG